MAPPARAGLFTDPDARVFTLSSDSRVSGIGRVRALPDGGVLFVSGVNPGLNAAGALWRLHVDGNLEALEWAGPILGLAVDGAGRAFVVREGRTAIERLDLVRRRRTVIADLRRALNVRDGVSLAVLENGSVLAAAGARLLRVGPRGTVRRLRSLGVIQALAPAGGGAFLALAGNNLVRVGPDGARRRLARHVTGTPVPLGDGRVVTVVGDGSASMLAVVAPDGGVTRLPWGTSATVTDGGLVDQTAWDAPSTMAVAADGSLVLGFPSGVRAVVPADSPRVRVAMLDPDRLLTGGAVAYVTGRPGHVRLEFDRAGTTVFAAEGEVTAPGGEFRLPAIPPLDLYDVRMRWTSGERHAEARARIGRRTSFTDREVEAWLTRSDGDEYSKEGIRPGPCRRPGPASAECPVFRQTAFNDETPFDFGMSDWPLGTAFVHVDEQGAIRTRYEYFDPAPAPPRLSMTGSWRRADAAIRVRVRGSRAGSAAAEVWIHRRDDRASLKVAAFSKVVSARTPWDLSVRLTPRQRAKVRRWLAGGRGVLARVEVTLVSDVGPGDATVKRSSGVPLKSRPGKRAA